MEPLVLVIVLKLVPWLIVGGGALVLARSPFGKALAQRIREGPATGADVAVLATELDEVRRELGEIHERLDFAERLLAQQRGALPPARPSEHDSPSPSEFAASGR